ncbi:hypothetical protein M8J76_016514 [Diaphorina citri]|nr:hypothetical protein M8J76_016514 [Diaphorina citri]
MSSDSDSDDQFESADEELDFEIEEQKPTNQSKTNKQVVTNLAQLSLKETSKSDSPQVKSSEPVNVLSESIPGKTNIVEETKEPTSQESCEPEEETKLKEVKQPSPNGINKSENIPTLVKLCKSASIPDKDSVLSSDLEDKIHQSTSSSEQIDNSEEGSVHVPEQPPPADEQTGKSNSSASVTSPTIPVKSNKDAISSQEPSIDADVDGWDVDFEDDLIGKTSSEQQIKPIIFTSKSVSDKTSQVKGVDKSQGISPHGGPSGERVSQIGDQISKKGGKPTPKEDDSGIDGWDVEMEDGFEIPVDLNKGSNANAASERFPFSLTSPLQKLTDSKEDSWGGWGAWGGVGNILSTATSGVTTLTSQVSHGFSQVLGAPDPAELAKLDKQLSEQPDQGDNGQSVENVASSAGTQYSTQTSSNPSEQPSSDTSHPSSLPGGLFSLSQLTRLVETTGSKVIAGGLDTLENLGKKTMEVLQEGDPGLKKKRALLFPNQDKPVLSQVLRDAKGRHESQDKQQEVQKGVSSALSSAPSSSTTSVKNLHFETLLDEYQGLAHLEALEIISKQCSMKLHNTLMSYSSNSGGEQQSQQMNDYQETLQQIREMCQVDDATDPDDSNEDDDDDNDVMGFEEKIEEIVRLYDLNSKLNCDKLIQVHKKITLQMDRLPVQTSCDVMYEQCLRSMAEFTSIAMDVFHKSASLLLLKSKHRTVDETDALTQFTYLLCSRIQRLSSAYSQAMLSLDKDSRLITNVYLEAANSCSYLQDASQLLIPVLQIVALPGNS